jgi:hypothetical protein
MPDISTAQFERRTTAATVAELEISVSFAIGNMSIGGLRSFREALKMDDELEQAERIASFLGDVQAEWDLTRGGEPIPSTTEGFHSVPLAVLHACVDAIFGELAPKDQNSPTSPSGSQPKESGVKSTRGRKKRS